MRRRYWPLSDRVKRPFARKGSGCHCDFCGKTLGATDLLLGAGWCAYPVLVGWGWIVINRANYIGARICFWSASIILGATTVMWGMSSETSLAGRATVAFLCGGLLLTGLSESLRWVTKEALAQTGEKMSQDKPPEPKTPPTANGTQYGPGQQFIAPYGTFYINPAPVGPQNSQNDPGHIWQDSVVVGTVIGGRRSPTDASQFLFDEITHAQQFNPGRTFHFTGVRLMLVHTESITDLMSNRPQDGRILTNVVARVADPPPP
jgi:hypothetical protein